jgi:hypothetical protein
MVGVIRTIPWFQEITTDSSNPTPSTGVDRGQTGPCKTSVFWRLARLEKRLDFGSATRNATPQAPCTELHGRYRRLREWPKMRKTLGKPGFFSGEDRHRIFGVFPMFLDSSKGCSREIADRKANRLPRRWRMTEDP